MATDRSNVKAGLFVLIGLVVAFVVVILLSDFKAMFTPMQTVQVRYHLSDGVKGLREGASVTIGGYPIGSVTDIESISEDGRITHQVVSFEIPRQYKLYDNARIELVTQLIGGGAALKITNVGSDPGNVDRDPATGARRRGGAWAYEPGDRPIPGDLARSPAVAQAVEDLGIGQRQRRQIQRIIANLEQLTAQTVDDPNQLKRILARIESITTKADQTLTRARALLDANSPMRRALATAERMLDENRPVVAQTMTKARNTMANAQTITGRLRDQTMNKISRTLDKANAAMDDARSVASDVETMITTQRPVLEKMIANLRLTSDQLKLAAIEIRRAPWRLLYEPDEKELETENLYDAARSFALAAGTLDSTADSLRTLVERDSGRIDGEDENLKLMLDKLHQSFEQLSEAEARFWQALKQQQQ
jgi:ABC-type transporter Mla subunit MlaD